MKPVIVLTGGGTAGHVTPNLALIPTLQDAGCRIEYIGSKGGMEEHMVARMDVPYHTVLSGKLRRYFSLKNFFDPFKVLIGIVQSYFLLRKLNTSVVFSKGGFVALPVVIGAWLNQIPVIAHESDMSPGLANRLSFPFVTKICVTFAAAKKYFKQTDKVMVTGTPIRAQLLQGNKANGLRICGFNQEKPCLLIVGGGQGSIAINQSIRQTLDYLSQNFQVIHLCGKGKVDESLINHANYYQLEYANEELADLFAAADYVISRAGANSLYEILVLEKPHILIPLSRQASRGDQIQNARYFEQQGISLVIDEAQLSPQTLQTTLNQLLERRDDIITKIHALKIAPATTAIVEIILTCTRTISVRAS